MDLFKKINKNVGCGDQAKAVDVFKKEFATSANDGAKLAMGNHPMKHAAPHAPDAPSVPKLKKKNFF